MEKRIGVCNLCEAICGLELTLEDGAVTGVRGNPDDMPLPTFVNLSALKPGFLRDLGL